MGNFLSTLIPKEWNTFWKEELGKEYLDQLANFLEAEYANQVCYPAKNQILAALENLKPKQVKCIILGQDPYHGPGQANGLAFSVQSKTKIPPSLRNIFKEYCEDLQLLHPRSGDLSSWRQSGVLLLNTALSVRQHQAGSHTNKGWETFTLALVKHTLLASKDAGFICFGTPASILARKVTDELNLKNRTLIETPHPSPLSAYRGFFGSKPFTRFNHEQYKRGLEIVPWELPSTRQQTLF